MRDTSRSRERSRSSERPNLGNTSPGAPRRRWWRWRSWRTLRDRTDDDVASAGTPGTGDDASLYLQLDRVCQQVLTYLPSLSSSTRKAICWCVALLVAWRVVIWALEMLVTSICFVVALLIITCFLRPDLALLLLTEALPYLEAARGWLSATFLTAGLSLTRRPLTAPAPAVPAEARAIEPPSPPLQRSSAHTIPTHLHSDDLEETPPQRDNLEETPPHRDDFEPAVVETAA